MEDAYWELPPEFKAYEALGALADGRIELVQQQSVFPDKTNNEIAQENFTNHLHIIEARQHSSTKNKFYTIKYSPETSQIMANDNATWFVGYLGYPALTLLLFIDKIKFKKEIVSFFKNIPFKEINQKNKNSFTKTQLEIDKILLERGLDLELLKQEIKQIFQQFAALALKPLGKKVRPPKGF